MFIFFPLVKIISLKITLKLYVRFQYFQLKNLFLVIQYIQNTSETSKKKLMNIFTYTTSYKKVTLISNNVRHKNVTIFLKKISENEIEIFVYYKDHY
jgi:hypothetical protein